jgi:hypothetical protein
MVSRAEECWGVKDVKVLLGGLQDMAEKDVLGWASCLVGHDLRLKLIRILVGPKCEPAIEVPVEVQIGPNELRTLTDEERNSIEAAICADPEFRSAIRRHPFYGPEDPDQREED